MPTDPSELLSRLVNASPDGLALLRMTGPEGSPLTPPLFTLLNPAAARWFLGVEGVGDCPRPVTDAAQHDTLVTQALATMVSGRARRLRIHPQDSARVGEVELVPFEDGHVIAAVRDITHLAMDEQLLAGAYEREAEARATLRAALDATPDAFAVFDVERDERDEVRGLRLSMVNRSGARHLAADGGSGQLIGRELRELCPDPATAPSWETVLAAAGSGSTRRMLVHSGPGTGGTAWEYTLNPVGRERIVITCRDVSERVHHERRLEAAKDQAFHEATHDALTGLGNRTLLVARLEEALSGCTGLARVAVAYFDLDNLKLVNDRFGHACGDRLLRAVGARLTLLLRGSDIAARLGGDEFVLMLGVPQRWDSDAFAERARAGLERPLNLPESQLHPRVSIGITVAVVGECVEEVLQRADRAMYADKRRRRGQWPARAPRQEHLTNR